jgi:integrase
LSAFVARQPSDWREFGEPVDNLAWFYQVAPTCAPCAPGRANPEKFQELIAILEEPCRTMAIVAICTGLRVSEVLALRWEHIDFCGGVILVQHSVVSGRIGKAKTEASQDEIPIDPAFAKLLLGSAGRSAQGLVFPSHVTGRSYHAGILQQKNLRPKGEEIGITKLGWHTFRLTCRSLLDEAGGPIGLGGVCRFRPPAALSRLGWT